MRLARRNSPPCRTSLVSFYHVESSPLDSLGRLACFSERPQLPSTFSIYDLPDYIVFTFLCHSPLPIEIQYLDHQTQIQETDKTVYTL